MRGLAHRPDAWSLAGVRLRKVLNEAPRQLPEALLVALLCAPTLAIKQLTLKVLLT